MNELHEVRYRLDQRYEMNGDTQISTALVNFSGLERRRRSLTKIAQEYPVIRPATEARLCAAGR